MAIEIITIPDLGGAESVEVIELCVSVGDSVEQEESLVVLESDKASMDVPSPFDGAVVKYLVAEGDTVKVGDAIAEVETAASEAVAEQAVEEVVEEAPAEPEPVEAAVEAPQATAVAETAEQIALVPDVGSDDKVELIEISVSVGDQVEEGDTLVVLESDKATMDVPSTLTGTVKAFIAKEGDKLATGDQVALIEVTSAAEVVAEAPAQVAPVAPAPSADPAPTPVAAPAAPAAPAAAVSNDSSDVYAGPSVRLLARELGVDLGQVAGTGPVSYQHLTLPRQRGR